MHPKKLPKRSQLEKNSTEPFCFFWQKYPKRSQIAPKFWRDFNLATSLIVSESVSSSNCVSVSKLMPAVNQSDSVYSTQMKV